MSPVEAMERVKRISPEDLNGMIEHPEVVILDVRTKQDWDASEEMIEGAIAEDPNHPDKWMGRYSRELAYVLYCASPDEATSVLVARKMMESGFEQVQVLKGGWKVWQGKGYPTVPK